MTVEQFLKLLKNVKRAGKGWTALCPAHNDSENSLGIGRSGERILIHCFAGCDPATVLAALGLGWSDLFANHSGIYKNSGEGGVTVSKRKTGVEKPSKSRVPGDTGFDTGMTPPGVKGDAPVSGLTVEELAQAKKLPVDFLRELGLRTVAVQKERCVKVPYFDESGSEIAVRFRLALSGGMRFKWRRGDRVSLYGLWRMEEAKKAGYILLVEGESDCWTCWHRGIPALGIPGKSAWRGEWAKHLDGLDVYLWCEPGAFDLIERVAKDIPRLGVIHAPNGLKDPSELHLSGGDFPREMERLLAGAALAQDEIAVRRSEELKRLASEAEAALKAPDPLMMVEKAIQGMGYGGDTDGAQIIYLAFTSRLLKMRPGTMPVHLLVKGPPSAGKTYAIQIVTRLHPAEAYHIVEAGSPRVLIYDEAELKHKTLVFGEADSLPSGEDNPAASAIRGLLQDNYLHYKVTEKDGNGAYHVREISKEGPTVLVTSSVKSLGEQLMTRLFTLEMPGEAGQVKNALLTQAQAEVSGVTDPDPALIAYQAYLQALAPWDVVVPFAKELAEGIAPAARPRILRDFQRLLSLIKAVAVLRHKHRKKDERGRLIATIEDYRYIHDLVREMYAATVTGASANVRRAVEAVAKLCGDQQINYAILAKELGVHKDLARRWANTAVKHGWLVNKADRGRVANLVIGEPLPEEAGLPDPDSLTPDDTTTTPPGVSAGVKIAKPESLDTQAFEDDTDSFDTVTPATPIDDEGGLLEFEGDADDIPF